MGRLVRLPLAGHALPHDAAVAAVDSENQVLVHVALRQRGAVKQPLPRLRNAARHTLDGAAPQTPGKR